MFKIKVFNPERIFSEVKLDCFFNAARTIQTSGRNNAGKKIPRFKFNRKPDPNPPNDTTDKKKDCATIKYLHQEPCLLDPCKPQPRIVIIGAGLAGLVCASRLSLCGFDNYILAEASEKPGGRILTAYVNKETVCELGAMWTQGGGPGNPLSGLASRAGLCQEAKEQLSVTDPLSLIYLKKKGGVVDPMSVTIGNQLFHQAIEKSTELYITSIGKGFGTLRNFITKRIEEELSAFTNEKQFNIEQVMFGRLNDIKARWGADPSEISAKEFGAFEELLGPVVRIREGLVGTLLPLIENIPTKNVVYKNRVQKIIWGSGKAEICTSAGERFDADHVVITLPLGVLKEEHADMFDPPLPKEKIAAISGLGFGKSVRVFLEYDFPFWRPAKGLFLGKTREDSSESEDWLGSLSLMEEHPGSPHFLTFQVGGDQALEVESATDGDIADGITKALKKYTGIQGVPKPNNVLKSEWCQNPHFNGVNTFMEVDSKASMICDLASPVAMKHFPNPILFFAGEATSDTYFSTLQGAFFSGAREAGRILELISKSDYVTLKSKN